MCYAVRRSAVLLISGFRDENIAALSVWAQPDVIHGC
jgi:hypothetical protein